MHRRRRRTGAIVTVAHGGNVTCTITNTAIAPRLTLVKTVVNDNGGTAVADRLDPDRRRAAPPSHRLPTGDPDASPTQPSTVGSYTLSETGPGRLHRRPPGPASTPADDPVTVTDRHVTLAVGDDVTCTIVNTAMPPTWSILKLSDPESGATVSPGDEITYGVFLIRHEGVDPRTWWSTTTSARC